MSKLIHCDGPGCDKSKAPDDERRMCSVPWIRVEPDGPSSALDFHADPCVVAYFSQTPTAAAGQPCTCHNSQVDPHTKGAHQAYPTATVVDGR